MAELINLRHARKQRDRREKEIRQQENRIRHGRPLLQKQLDEDAAERLERHVAGHQLEKPCKAEDGQPEGEQEG